MFYTKLSPMLETKVILSTVFYLFGIPITLLGIIENYGTWKADLLFVMSGMLILAKICFFVVDKNQQRQKRNMDLEEQRHELDKKKKKEKPVNY